MPSLARIFSRLCFGLGAAALAVLAAQPAQAQAADTSFFITSVGIGNGANLGGLAGADNYCQTLAQAAGAGAKPGALISRPRKPTASPRLMRVTGSAGGPGRIPRAS
jgi:hypothetical protein